nr:MAG TPA: hypothetical protein [Caudoviricetes sp.]
MEKRHHAHRPIGLSRPTDEIAKQGKQPVRVWRWYKVRNG